jgi:hypothetical protein
VPASCADRWPFWRNDLTHHRRRLDLINGSEAFIEDLQIAHWQEVAPRLDSAAGACAANWRSCSIPGGRQQERRQQRQSHAAAAGAGFTSRRLLIQVGRNHRQNDWISLRQAAVATFGSMPRSAREAMWC